MSATTEPADAPVDNHAFLTAVFGEHAPEAHITSFTDPPDAITPERRGTCWGGRKYRGRSPKPEANNYFTISTFDPLRDGTGWRDVRRKAQFRAGHCVVIDDIGTKVEPSQVKLPLSWELATSAKSRQGGYILDTPCSDQMLFSGLLAALVARGLSIDGKDPGMKGVTRYVRLPIGFNNKTAYGGVGVVCQLLQWHPQRRYSIAQILDAYGISEAEARALGEGIGGEGRDTGPKDDPLLAALTGAGLYRSKGNKAGWHEITCPWVDEHSNADDSGTAVFVGAEPGRYGFACHHGHCEHKNVGDLRAWLAEHESPVTPFTPVDGGSVAPPAAARPAGWLRPFSGPVLHKPAPVQFAWQGWMQQGKVGLLAAEGGCGKTTLLVMMGISVVTGRDFMGEPVRQGPFVLLSRDDDQDDLDAVVQELSIAMQLDAEEVELVQRDLYPRSLRSEHAAMLISPKDSGREYRFSQFFTQQLLPELQDIRPVAVAFDTVRQFTGVETTNEGAQIVFMSACARVAEVTGASVIAAHHVGKQAAREKIVDMYSAIGSSALSDNARFMWRLIAVDPSADGVVLPFAVTLTAEQSLLQLISTRGSLRVRQPADIYYTREEFTLKPIEGTVRRLSTEERKAARNEQRTSETLERLQACFLDIGVVGRDRARAYFAERGWTLSNDQFAALKAAATEGLE